MEIAGAGFINFFLEESAYHAEIGRMLARGRRLRPIATSAAADRCWWNSSRRIPPDRCTSVTAGTPPTARALANLLEAVGFRVAREYYINDAGRQMEILAVSTWLRYLERCGERLTFPANGYRGDYIVRDRRRAATRRTAPRCARSAAEVFADLPPDEPQGGDKDVYIDALIARARALLGEAAFRRVLDHALGGILADIREDLAEFGVTFDRWFSERSPDRRRLDRPGDRGAASARATPTSRTARCGSRAPTTATRRIA